MTCPDCRANFAPDPRYQVQCRVCGWMPSNAREALNAPANGTHAIPDAGTPVRDDEGRVVAELDGETEVVVERVCARGLVLLRAPRWPNPGWDERRYIWLSEWKRRREEDCEAPLVKLTNQRASGAAN
jgi:hypothetical protein